MQMQMQMQIRDTDAKFCKYAEAVKADGDKQAQKVLESDTAVTDTDTLYSDMR